METPTRIFLVGPMGAGKSSIGRELARRLGYPFHDTDDYLRERTGVDIATIFDFEGEAGFRKREHDALAELSRQEPIVLATGGGTVILDENRRLLAERGFVVYLRTSLEYQLARTRQSRHDRPLLETEDPERKLRELAEQRDPLYRELADMTVDTDGQSVKQVMRKLALEIHGAD
ncbi:shikimate kinase AroK [Natronospira bacteriovora]|uniref:Shikimate kinase n=1 Tax=Natronospira bacteriovora TaxID=3069753 RepID=A0ABU0W863_9GAMM|nr:shikimate kinase AroK [Natronospira sp. AB-CW4]MDQ2070204.1 shikimate kinase AroK [Natronospira sp. AB-CW4]